MRNAITRRSFLLGIPAISAIGTSGCKSVPGEYAVSLASRGIGCAVGIVLNECNMSHETRAAVIDLMERIVAVTPGPGETLTVTWGTEAKKHIDSLVSEGKVRPLVGAIALAAFAVAVYGYTILETRYPHARIVRSLTCAAVEGFALGFIMAFKVNKSSLYQCDTDAYRILSTSPQVSALKNLVEVVAQSNDK